MSDQRTEHVLSREQIYKGSIFEVEHLTVALPNGRSAVRDVVRHKGASAVLPVDEKGNAYLVRQYRVALGRETLEIPAGKLDQVGEAPLAAANRELREETGLTAKHMQYLTAIDTTVGFCDERIHLYLATGLEKGLAEPDEDEFVDVVTLPLDKLLQAIHQGEICDAKTIVAAFMASAHLPGFSV